MEAAVIAPKDEARSKGVNNRMGQSAPGVLVQSESQAGLECAGRRRAHPDTTTGTPDSSGSPSATRPPAVLTRRSGLLGYPPWWWCWDATGGEHDPGLRLTCVASRLFNGCSSQRNHSIWD
jgi:hypothetical protein